MIRLEDVVAGYESRLILKHVDLTIESGETLVVIGGSGAGKSTLLRILIGLQSVVSGHVYIDDTDVTTLSEAAFNELRQRMGMVFQYSALFDSMTVGENVAFGLKQHTHMSKEEIAAIVAEKLKLVGLPGIEDYMPSELSGGMKKRVGLARAIAFNPSIILYDEPTSGLDPVTSATISHLIRDMQTHLKCTSIVVTHDMQSAFYIADRIALLHEGHFIEIGTPEEFRRSNKPLVQAFINGEQYGEGG